MAPPGATPTVPFRAPITAALPFSSGGASTLGPPDLPRALTIAPAPPPESAAAVLPFALPSARASLPALGELPSAPPPAAAAPGVHWSLVRETRCTVGESSAAASTSAPELAKERYAEIKVEI